MRVATKLFKLRTNMNHYIEFQMGLDSFRFEFKWNDIEKKYSLDIYKNLELKVSSYFIVWSAYNILAPFSYLNLGSLQLVCDNREGETNKFIEISKDNIQEVIFRWDYEIV